MNSILFQVDPMAASSYGLYKAAKDNEGSFVDFLLSYDSKGANEGDNSWLNKVLSQDVINKITSPQMAKVLNFANINTHELFSTQDFFDTKVSMYKMQISQEMAKREGEASEEKDIAQIQSNANLAEEQLKKLALNQYSTFSTFF